MFRPPPITEDLKTDAARVVGVPWHIFLAWWQDSWAPGAHLALVGPTGEGKTTFAVGVLQQRKWVLALDPKGEDDTLSASGFLRITSLPLPRSVRKDIAEGRPARLIIGGASNSTPARLKLRHLMAEAVEMVRQQGGWTIYADEFQVLSDLRMFGLGKPIEELLITARKNKTSVVTAFQAPAWVPKAATRQAWGVAIWGTRDKAMVKSVAESMGREWQEVWEIIKAIPQWYVIIIPKSIHSPIVITHPPAVN
jgi:hypothetical protein